MSSTRKPVLGRGLDALLSSASGAGASQDDVEGSGYRTRADRMDERSRLGRIADVDVDNISPNPYQPRRDFDEKALEELAASITQLGIIQPITVRALGQGRYELISGERRLRAARRAGLKQVPAYVRNADTEEMLEMALVENVQREELNPVEIALGYQRLMDECDLTQEQVAQKVGKNRATVANFLRLLKLPPRVQAGLRDGSISAGHARALINVEDEGAQLQILKNIEENGLSVREVEDLVRAWHNRQAAPPTEESALPRPQPDRSDLEVQRYIDVLRSRLSTQVHIKHKSDQAGGKIEIAYYSADDLERLIELLND